MEKHEGNQGYDNRMEIQMKDKINEVLEVLDEIASILHEMNVDETPILKEIWKAEKILDDMKGEFVSHSLPDAPKEEVK
jgi:hypothetical protein